MSVVLSMGVSIDGFMEGPGSDISWHQVDEEVHEHFNRVFSAAGAFLEGRVSYELMEGFWPTADSEPGTSPQMAEFADIWRAMPKVVYSRTLQQVGPNARLVREVVAEEVRALEAEFEGDLFVGGANLAGEFLRQDLVDELRIYVHPVLLGHGTPMFQDSGARRALRLVEIREFGNGVVLLRHERAPET